MELELTGPVFTWRGPAPHHFVAVPEEQAEQIRDLAAAVTYGWGMVPVTVLLGRRGGPPRCGPRTGRTSYR